MLDAGDQKAGVHGVTRPTTESDARAPVGRAVLWAPLGRILLRAAGLQPLQSEAGDFARVFQVELVFDVRSVRLHRFWTEIQ